MTRLTFYPLENADCCLIDLNGGQKLLFDYANQATAEEGDLRIDLPAALRQDLEQAERDYYDVVAFTHLDEDHIQGSSQFFWLEHAKKYQDDDRIRIRELWVPAAIIVEEANKDEARILQQEARHRLRQRQGIRVFSRPQLLHDWLDDQGMTIAQVEHLVTDAGQLVPTFNLDEHGVEFFVHAPFAKRMDGEGLVDRNKDSLVLQVVFRNGDRDTKVLFGADVTHEILTDIVNITNYHERPWRLEYDVFKLPHHCSYKSLGTDKGQDKTEPVPMVKSWFEDHGMEGATLVSTSKPIPSQDTDQPPHRQAASYYRECAAGHGGRFLVTMEQPTPDAPKPLTLEIDSAGVTLLKRFAGGVPDIIRQAAPKAG